MSVTTAPRPLVTTGAAPTFSGAAGGLRVWRWDERQDGPMVEEALQARLNALGYALLPLVDPQGAIVSARVHPLDRAVAVLAGLLQITIGGESAILTTGDIGLIPAGAVRRVEAVGTSPILCVEAVCRDTKS